MHDTHESLAVFSSFGELKTVMQHGEKGRWAAFLLPAKVKTTQTVGEAHTQLFKRNHNPSDGGEKMVYFIFFH